MAAAAEGDGFHNRLTHSLKVAQLSRRLAEKFLREQPEACTNAGGIDPDVCEAAGLGHDIGHPPFGHVGETTLDRIATKAGLDEGFEGNAQSFRILCRLALRHPSHVGLNLTAASLNAVTKYPRPRFEAPERIPGPPKFGFYASDRTDFEFARAIARRADRKTPEAEIMDWADDVTYATHDVDDFYRAGLVPLELLRESNKEQDRFLDWVHARWESQGRALASGEWEEVRRSFVSLMGVFPLDEPYNGSRSHRASLRNYISQRISGMVRDTRLAQHPQDSYLEIAPAALRDVELLKELIWYYVIERPGLATQQIGKARIVEEVFDCFLEAIASPDRGQHGVLPRWVKDQLAEEIEETVVAEPESDKSSVRHAVDAVASLSEPDITLIHGRIKGYFLGSVADLVR